MENTQLIKANELNKSQNASETVSITVSKTTSANTSEIPESLVEEDTIDDISCDRCCEDYSILKFFDEGYVKNQIIVNFYMRGRYVYTYSYGSQMNVKQVKYDVSNKFRIPEEYLQILHWHVFLADCVALAYIPTECKGFLDLTVVNTSSFVPYEVDIVDPDIITVFVELDHTFKEITVEIEDRRIRKPYLGGYRSTKSGIEYHNAYSQTGPPQPTILSRYKFTRHTQTVIAKDRKTIMDYSRATQMSNEHSWIHTIEDKILTSKPYETADEREARIGVEKAVRTIQRYYRSWKLMHVIKYYSAEYHRRLQHERDEQAELIRDCERQRKREIINKVFPRTRADFNMLYAMVDRWKKAHIERISKLHTTASKLAEFYLLLNKEIEMLSVIEKQRNKLRQEMKIVDEIRFFHYISDPVRWIGYKGAKIRMHTMYTQKGRFFKELYYNACKENISVAERLGFIDDLSTKLREHNCNTGNEIVSLLEREKQLITHGMENKDLDVLRKRIRALLLKHIKTTECNEGVTKRMVVVKEKEMENNLFFCQRCEKLKSYREFPLSHRNTKLTVCLICSSYDRTAEPYFDIAPYRFMLRCIRRDERKRQAASSLVFIMQERDIHYLVERIWHAQSIISEYTELDLLRLVRWNMEEEWSPWNCILLTEEEAKLHIRIHDLNEVYDEELIKIIISKHMFARCVFANVLLLERSMRSLDAKNEAIRKAAEDPLLFKPPVLPCSLHISEASSSH